MIGKLKNTEEKDIIGKRNPGTEGGNRMKFLRCMLSAILILSLLFSAAAAETAVIYFSCTGNTETIARWIAEETGGDLIRILPEEPYTAEDLKYYTDCRADREQADETARPGIANMPESIGKYDVIFLGYPIWHGKAPKIMYTLMEGMDISGKTIIPFCTSGSSPIGNSASALQQLSGEPARWLEGKRFSGNAAKEEVSAWTGSLKLPKEKNMISITVDGKTVTAELEDNASAEAFLKLLQEGDLTIEMEDYGGFEKVGPLGTAIVRSDEKITTAPGDLILYQGDKVTIYYAENTWTFTRLGHITGATAESMKAFLGEGNPTVVFSAAEILPGDVNGDGMVDGRDSIRLMKYLAKEIDEETGKVFEIREKNADLNQDEEVDEKDLMQLMNDLAEAGER